MEQAIKAHFDELAEKVAMARQDLIEGVRASVALGQCSADEANAYLKTAGVAAHVETPACTQQQFKDAALAGGADPERVKEYCAEAEDTEGDEYWFRFSSVADALADFAVYVEHVTK